MLSHLRTFLTGFLIIGFISACGQSGNSASGLFLPPGNVEDGKGVFVNLGCVQCHSVINTELPESEEESRVMLELGGEFRRVKTYSELITSITNPQHIISTEYLKKIKTNELAMEKINSPMLSFNNDMSVQQLIDLVSFLDTYYKKSVPQYIGHGIQYVQH